MNAHSARQQLKHAITTQAYVRAEDETLINRSRGIPQTNGWIFDFRRIVFDHKNLAATATAFWQTFKDNERIQIAGLETAALPIVTALMLKQPEMEKPLHGFFIRKSRKKDGLMRMIEGMPDDTNVPVVLVDDILNSGKSFIRQIEVLEELGYTIKAVWCILRFRDSEFYDYFAKKNIAVHSLFSLSDFKDTLGTEDLGPREFTPPTMPFDVQWKFAGSNPNYFYVVPKSDPVIDSKKIYMGTDSGHFVALNQHDGSTAWSYKVGYHAKGKSIFSSPALHSSGLVIFGAYDGNVYALESDTGKKRWIFFEADHIGSSPALAEDLGLVFVGLEFGLIRKRGGIAALDVHTGTKKWEFPMAAYTHSSPLYIQKKRQVVIGGNEGVVYLLNAKNGTVAWEFKTGDVTEDEVARGFSRFDIKESFAYDAKRDLIILGNADAKVFALHRKTGKVAWQFDGAEFGFYSTPLVYKDTVIVSSLDKYLYCLNLDTGEIVWKWHAGARIFASPILINGCIVIGSNTGRMTEIDPTTGKELSFITVSERITNKVAYNKDTKRYFLPTFANELYCLEKKHDKETS